VTSIGLVHILRPCRIAFQTIAPMRLFCEVSSARTLTLRLRCRTSSDRGMRAGGPPRELHSVRRGQDPRSRVAVLGRVSFAHTEHAAAKSTDCVPIVSRGPSGPVFAARCRLEPVLWSLRDRPILRIIPQRLGSCSRCIAWLYEPATKGLPQVEPAVCAATTHAPSPRTSPVGDRLNSHRSQPHICGSKTAK
jgi:hypothetical protein